MSVLTFEGVVDDQCDDRYHGVGCFTVGDRYPLHEADEMFGYAAVTVAFADAEHPVWSTIEGALDADHGSAGYSEWTPGDVASLSVGAHSFNRELFDACHDNRRVRLVIADEPVDLLDLFPPTE